MTRAATAEGLEQGDQRLSIHDSRLVVDTGTGSLTQAPPLPDNSSWGL